MDGTSQEGEKMELFHTIKINLVHKAMGQVVHCNQLRTKVSCLKTVPNLVLPKGLCM